MTFGELWAVALGTLVALGLLLGLFLFKKALKKRLFTGEPETPREQAMAELLLLQAELEKRAESSEGSEAGGEEGPGGGTRGLSGGEAGTEPGGRSGRRPPG